MLTVETQVQEISYSLLEPDLQELVQKVRIKNEELKDIDLNSLEIYIQTFPKMEVSLVKEAHSIERESGDFLVESFYPVDILNLQVLYHYPGHPSAYGNSYIVRKIDESIPGYGVLYGRGTDELYVIILKF